MPQHLYTLVGAFSGYVRGEQRLLPLYFNDKETHFWKVSGYRQEAVVPFETETVQACSGCHGLNEEKPSAHGIPCGGCHGKLDGHVTDGQHTTDSSNRANLDSFEGHAFGQCHTHAKVDGIIAIPQPKEHFSKTWSSTEGPTISMNRAATMVSTTRAAALPSDLNKRRNALHVMTRIKPLIWSRAPATHASVATHRSNHASIS